MEIFENEKSNKKKRVLLGAIIFIFIAVLLVGVKYFLYVDNSQVSSSSFVSNYIEDYKSPDPFNDKDSLSYETNEHETYQVENLTFKNDVNKLSGEYISFKDKEITFAFSGRDASGFKKKMRGAFQEMQDKVGEFNFTEIEDYGNADIKINIPISNNLMTLAEALPELNEEGWITGGNITLIQGNGQDCGPNSHMTEMHELLHIFGFGHEKGHGLMGEYADGCYSLSQNGQKYIEHLKYIYSDGLHGKEHSELEMYKLEEFYYFTSSCPEGNYPATNSEEYCCPDKGSFIGSDGYCYIP